MGQRIRIIIILLVLFLGQPDMLAQKYDYNWLFGYDSFNPLDTIADFGGSDISFNYSPPRITQVDREMNIGAENAIMSDAAGNLLFYTNGCYISRGDHMRMLGGDCLNPSNYRRNICPDGYGLVQ